VVSVSAATAWRDMTTPMLGVFVAVHRWMGSTVAVTGSRGKRAGRLDIPLTTAVSAGR